MPVHDPQSGPPDPELADELFRLVEQSQGFAFISDGIEVLSKAEIVQLAKNSLAWTNDTALSLRRFIKRQGG